jgi:hypothetical protein
VPGPEYWEQSWGEVTSRFPEDSVFNITAVSKEYVRKDVIATLEAYKKVAELIHVRFQCLITDYITLPHFAFSMWQKTVLRPLYLPNEEAYRFIASAFFAGRCYPRVSGFKSAQYNDIMNCLELFMWDPDMSDEERKLKIQQVYDGIDDYTVDLDVVSLYPTAMRHNIPVGLPRFLETHEVDQFNEMLKEAPENLILLWDIERRPNTGWHGVFNVEYIPNKFCTEPILPRRTPQGGLQWTLEPGVGTFTSLDLWLAVRAGYVINKVFHGLVYESAEPCIKDYIDQCYFLKQEGENTGNQVLRSMGKLMLNSVYGKFGQRPIYNKSATVASVTELCEFMQRNEWNGVVGIPEHRGLIVTGEVLDPKEREKCITKPNVIGAFILAHSRRIMLDILAKADPYLNTKDWYLSMRNMPLYGDTDSLHFHARQLPFLHDCMGKDMGKLTNDLGGGCKIIQSFFISPKLYLCEYITPDGKIHHHMRAKGVPGTKVTPEIYHKLHQERLHRLEGKESIADMVNEIVYLKEKMEGASGEEERRQLEEQLNLYELAVEAWSAQEFGSLIEFKYWRRSGLKTRVYIDLKSGESERMEALRVRLSEQSRTLGKSLWEGRDWLWNHQWWEDIQGVNTRLEGGHFFSLPVGHIAFDVSSLYSFNGSAEMTPTQSM